MKRYACIGGPLNRQWVTSKDFYPGLTASTDTGRWNKGDVISPPGQYGHLNDDYTPYNCAEGARFAPARVYLHSSIHNGMPGG